MSKESDDKLAGDIVGTMRAVFGKHHARAAHAKGIVLEGHFASTEEACTLSDAAVFCQPSVPITLRFSDFTGLPDIADTDGNADPRGMAVRFHAGGEGRDLDIVAQSFNGFPSATAQDFAELVHALAASGPGTASPTALDTYLASHPAAKTFFTTQKPPPESFATAAFFGVNAVTFNDGAGRRTHVRHRFVPRAGEHYLDAATRTTKGPNYLFEEIARRMATGPVQFEWKVQIAQPGDRLDDPSTVWPESRRLVTVGLLSIERPAADQTAAGKILFGPGRLPAGITAADPMLKIRDTAYFISSKDRQ
jgi:catalase